MTIRLTPEQVIPAWQTLTVEVVFAPETGSLRPWELYGCFAYPHKSRTFWGSFKTEAAAQKSAAKALKNAAKTYGRAGE